MADPITREQVEKSFRNLVRPPELFAGITTGSTTEQPPQWPKPGRVADSPEAEDKFSAQWGPAYSWLAGHIAAACGAVSGPAGPITIPEGQLLLILEGEVRVTRRPSSRVASTVLGMGQGAVLGGSGLEPLLRIFAIPHPRASSLDKYEIFPAGPSRAQWCTLKVVEVLQSIKSPGTTDPGELGRREKLAEAFRARLRSLYFFDRFFERTVSTLRQLEVLRRMPLDKLSQTLRGACYLHAIEHEFDLFTPDKDVRFGKRAGVYISVRGPAKLAMGGLEAEGARSPEVQLTPWRPVNTLEFAPGTSARIGPESERSPVSLVLIAERAIMNLLGSSESFRRRVLQTSLPGSTPWRWAQTYDQISVELMAFVGPPARQERIVALADEVAVSLRRCWRERVLRLIVAKGDDSKKDTTPELDWDGSILRVWFLPDKGKDRSDYARVVMMYWLGKLLCEYDFVIMTADIDVDPVVFEAVDTIVDCRWGDAEDDAGLGGLRPDTAGVLPVDIRPPDARGEPGLKTRIATSNPLPRVRVRADGDVFYQADVDRLGRALSGRLVGVALGGGGALGYANVALLRGMSDPDADPIPIDVVSGVSFGAMVGAYFCAGEYVAGTHDLLNQLTATLQVLRLQAVSFAALLVPGQVAAMVNRDLGGKSVSEMTIRFLPFAVEAGSLEPVVISDASIGEAVAASAAAPGLFAPVRIGDQRFVDGAVIANVPTEMLLQAGCGVTVAMDPIPVTGASSMKAADRDKGFRIGDLMAKLDVLDLVPRFLDSVRSGERVLSLLSESAAAPADVSIKLPSGSAFRMPLFLFPSALLDRAAQDLASRDVLHVIRTLYRQQRRPEPGPMDPTFVEPAVKHRLKIGGAAHRRRADKLGREDLNNWFDPPRPRRA